MELLRAIVYPFLLPPGAQMLMFCFALAIWRWWPRASRSLIAISAGSLVVLSMPVVSDGLTRATGSFVPYLGGSATAQAIVILAAERREAPEYGGETVGPVTLERLRMGAHWARASGLPVLLTGGRVDSDDADSLATLMDRTWRADFGLQARWMEGTSRNTRENALQSAAILRAAGISHVLLVTHYAHMARALADFNRAGIQAEPVPTGFPALGVRNWATGLWPGPRCLQQSALALHELYALAARALGADV